MKLFKELYLTAGDQDWQGNEYTEDRYIIVDAEGFDVMGDHMSLTEAEQVIKEEKENIKYNLNTNKKMAQQAKFNQAVNNYESNKSESAEAIQKIWSASHGESYNKIVVNACGMVGKEKVFNVLLSLGTAEFYLNNVITPKLK